MEAFARPSCQNHGSSRGAWRAAGSDERRRSLVEKQGRKPDTDRDQTGDCQGVEDAKRALETLNRGLSEDILAEYIAWLESDIGVTINQSALNQVVSGGAGDGTN